MTRGSSMALTAAFLFGAGSVACKALLPSLQPQLLAGLLYTSSGVALSLILWMGRTGRAATPVRLRHLPWLALAILSGGIVAPILLMRGLELVPASSAALLLALETPLTAFSAWGRVAPHSISPSRR